MFFLCIVVNLSIFPAVAEVAFPSVEKHKTVFHKNAIRHRSVIVVLVNFWKSVVEMVFLMKNQVR